MPETGAQFDVSIVMPSLNEAETLDACVREARGWLDSSPYRSEIVVADNGSTDGSIEIAERCGARIVRVPLRGYGAALYFGIRAASGFSMGAIDGQSVVGRTTSASRTTAICTAISRARSPAL